MQKILALFFNASAPVIRVPQTLSCVLLAATPAFAGEPAALVTDVSGEVSPAVGSFHELDAGTEVRVGGGASLTLEHYASCEAATVTGGSVVVRADGLDLSQAKVGERIETPCSAPVSLRSDNMVGAGIVLRGVGSPTVPLSPEIVVAGGGARYDSMRIEREGQPVWTLPVRDGRVEWPKDRLFLTDQGTYVLVLAGPAGERSAKVVADREASGRTVLRP